MQSGRNDHVVPAAMNVLDGDQSRVLSRDVFS